MVRRALVLCFALLLLPGVIHAQGGLEDWPPDPQTLFTSAVEVISVEIEEPEPDLRPRTDNDRRVTRVYDTTAGEWREYLFPEVFVSAGYNGRIDERGVQLRVTEIIPDDSQREQIWIWFLDPVIGSYTRYGELCGVQPPLIGASEWVLATDPESGRLQPCRTEDGMRASLLPDFITLISQDWLPPDLSGVIDGPIQRNYETTLTLNEEWLIFFGQPVTQTTPRSVTVYSYELDTGRVNELGTFEPYGDYYVGERPTASKVVIRSSIWTGPNDAYVADATQPGSLVLALSNLDIECQPGYLPNPPRLQTFYSLDCVTMQPVGCVLATYDIESGQYQEIDYGGLCTPEYGPMDAEGYYRELPQEALDRRTDSPTATLVRYHPLTGEREALFVGEIEYVNWVSPDERLAALILDSSGSVDHLPAWPDDWLDSLPAAPVLSIVDLGSGRHLYDLPTNWRYYGGATAYVQALTKDRLLVVDAYEDMGAPWRFQPFTRFPIVFDTRTETEILIMSSLNEGYTWYVVEREDDLIEIAARPQSDGNSDETRSEVTIHYTVRLAE